MKLVGLLGKRPIVNLMAVRALQPDEILFVGTKDTHAIAQNLQSLVGNHAKVHQIELFDPYDALYMIKAVRKKLGKLGWLPKETCYDLSGGSKLMFYAATELAKANESPAVDIERVGHRYRIRQFELRNHHVAMTRDEFLPALISIADYLNCYLPGFREDGFSRDDRGRIDIGGRFEQTVYNALAENVDELKAGVRPDGVADQIEIDLVVRQGNNVAIIEAKTGVKKAGIDQLDTAGNPHYLGDFLAKLLVTGRYLPRAHKALATAQEIRVIELPGYSDRSGLPANEKQILIQAVQQTLSGR
jgi:hypothetical protein